MKSTQSVIDTWSAYCNAHPAFFSSTGKIKFEIEGDGAWQINGNTITNISPSSNADTTVTLSKETLIEIINGELNPQVAFLSGKIRISGEESLALPLYKLFEIPQ